MTQSENDAKTEADAGIVGKMVRRSASEHTPCGCHICSTSRALRDARTALNRLDDATEAWVNHDEEESMSYAFLLDEVRAVVAGPWEPAASIQRLQRALEIVQPARGESA